MQKPPTSQTGLIIEDDDGGCQAAKHALKKKGSLANPRHRRVHGREALDDLIERINALAQQVLSRFDVALSPDIL